MYKLQGSHQKLPTVFAQPTERNERILSLMSAIVMRSIRPQFKYAIRRHPLSLWSAPICREHGREAGRMQSIPVVLLLEKAPLDESLKVISNVLKKEIANSGFLVTNLSAQKPSVVLNCFHPSADIFVIDLGSGADFGEVVNDNVITNNLVGLVSLNPKKDMRCLETVPQLLLIPRHEDCVDDFTQMIHHHHLAPNAAVLSLPGSIDAYGDDGMNTLWMARTILKWMKAVKLTEPTVIRSML